jgi:hypothetical protein
MVVDKLAALRKKLAVGEEKQRKQKEIQGYKDAIKRLQTKKGSKE